MKVYTECELVREINTEMGGTHSGIFQRESLCGSVIVGIAQKIKDKLNTSAESVEKDGIVAISIALFWVISNTMRNRYLKFQINMRRQILTAKSGISNHAAAGIRDDPCLSKFETLYGLCPQASRQF